MKYSLRSLMIGVMLGPPILATAIILVPPFIKDFFAARPKATTAPVPAGKIVFGPPPMPMGAQPKGDFKTPAPALKELLETDRNWPSDYP